MTTIKILPQVKINIVNEEDENITDKSCSMNRFLKMAIEQYPLFGKGLKNIKRGIMLIDLIENAVEKLELEDADYKTLCDAVDNLEWKHVAAAKFVTFYEAVANVDKNNASNSKTN